MPLAVVSVRAWHTVSGDEKEPVDLDLDQLKTNDKYWIKLRYHH